MSENPKIRNLKRRKIWKIGERPKIRKSARTKSVKNERKPENSKIWKGREGKKKWKGTENLTSRYSKKARENPRVKKCENGDKTGTHSVSFLLRFRHGLISRSIQWRSPMSLDRENKRGKDEAKPCWNVPGESSECGKKSVLECAKGKPRG